MRFQRLAPVLPLLVIGAQFRATGQPSPWTHFTLSGPGPNLNSNLPVYDPGSNRLIFFGGVARGPCCTGISDTWVLTNANGLGGTPQWQELAPSGPLPAGRVSHSAVYDQLNNRMVIFGGATGDCGAFCTLFNDVWVLANANGVGGAPTWTQLNPSAPNGYPAARSAHRAIYDPTTNRMTVFGGGNDGTAERNDTWVFTNANGLGGTAEWIQLAPAGGPPDGREVFVSTYDPAANAMTVFGGCCPFFGDLWVLSDANGVGTPSWRQITQTSPAPGTLANWNYGYDSAANSIIFFGGSPSFGAFRNDVWVLQNANGIGAPTWVNSIPNGAPGSPPAGAPLGTYDPFSKRLMIIPDATDLWVLDATTSLGQEPCSAIINGAVSKPLADGANIYAAFTPNFGLSLSQAAAACGFTDFDWEQQVTQIPDPSPFYTTAGTQLTSAYTPFNDPPPGGYAYCVEPPINTACNQYPFYYNPDTQNIAFSMNKRQTTDAAHCLHPDPVFFDVTNPTTLCFWDDPTDPCIEGPSGPSSLYLTNPSLCNNRPAPYGSFQYFTTRLVGVLPIGSNPRLVPLPEMWTWKTNWNGTDGGVVTEVGALPPDPGSGTGGVTITSINGVLQTPPSVTCAANPNSLWPPDGKPVLVTVSGLITPGTSGLVPGGTAYAVVDEYGQDQPSGTIALGAGGAYSFGVLLIAARNGNDQDGRTYTIAVGTKDTIGNIGSCSTVVTVPHDQGKP